MNVKFWNELSETQNRQMFQGQRIYRTIQRHLMVWLIKSTIVNSIDEIVR